MSMNLAPYHAAMRIGQGFNSYTHEILVNDAVIYDKDAAGGDHYQSDSGQVSQIVSYCTRHVDKLSEVTDAMNVSAALSIKTASAGGGLAGSYIDSDKFKESSVNFFVQVKVVNQTIMAEDVRQFNQIEGVSNTANFMKVYGDSFISGFIEGGELDALISIKVTDQSTVKNIKASLEASFGKGALTASASFGLDKENAWKNAETTITVNWNGGGEIKQASELWSIESLTKAAAAFPNNVARCPQRTFAILTKYETLMSFQKIPSRPTVLDYDVASLYTNDLLDAMMAYKKIWKDIHRDLADYEAGLVTLAPKKLEDKRHDGRKSRSRNKKMESSIFLQEFADVARTNSDETGDQLYEIVKRMHSPGSGHSHHTAITDIEYPENAGVPYAADEFGLEKAKKDCRMEMLKIVKEVDQVIADPRLALDPEREVQYTYPPFFRRLLPVATKKPVPVLTTTTASGPELHKRLYYSPVELPPHFKPYYDKAIADPKAEKFLMTPWAGDRSMHEPGSIFSDFPELSTNHLVKSVTMWTLNDPHKRYIECYEIQFFNDKPKIFRRHDGGTTIDPNTTAETITMSGQDEKIVSVQLIAGKFEFEAKVLCTITFTTNKGQSKTMGKQDLPNLPEKLWTDAPLANYSFKGFWGEGGAAFDRMGVFYSLDE